MGANQQALNLGQIHVLKQLYSFRYATVSLLGQDYGLKIGRRLQPKLDRLMQRGYIGRHYDQHYRLLGQPAVYYLLPRSFPVLQQSENISPPVIKNLYKNQIVSQRFINHCLDIYKVYLALKQSYNNHLWFFNDSELKFEQYHYFPKPLPDAYLSLKMNEQPRSTRKHFLLDIYSSQTPLFVHLKKLKAYTDYLSADQWTEATSTKLSGILMVTDTFVFQHKLIGAIANRLDLEGLDDDVTFYITSIEQLTRLTRNSIPVWQKVIQPTIGRSLEKM